MNDVLKFISKSLEPFGYHVRPRTGLNLLRIANLEKNNTENVALPRRASDNPVPEPPEGNLNAFIIYLRTCLRDKRNIDTKPRIGGGNMTETTLRCVLSLIKAVEHAQSKFPDVKFSMIVLDDHSDEAPRQKLDHLLKITGFPVKTETTKERGQGQSLHEQFSKSRSLDAIVYFVEDDYLHEEDGIAAMIGFYRDMTSKTGSHLVLYPQEHNSLYSHHYPSYIIQGEDRHWRSVRHATHTFVTHGKVVEKYWHYFENTKFVGNKKKRKLGSEARTTNNLFKHIPGFSPLKPCAVHLQFEELLPPFYDWRPLWERSTI
jgi:hypothetical protein